MPVWHEISKTKYHSLNDVTPELEWNFIWN